MIKSLRWLYNDLTPHKRVLRFVVFVYFLVWEKLRRKDEREHIWLIGESRGDCLQENGYHFFLYCRKRHPERQVYFVINESSPHFVTLANDRNVLAYGSPRHIDAYVRAATCFYTHTYSDFIYREQFLAYHKSKKLVFLHHGVLGFKQFNKRYLANRNIMDLFVVGSELERNILVDQVGVAAEKIKVTGYARYDVMENSTSPDSLQIAYIPTHRNWLRVPAAHFHETEFYKRVDELIRSPVLHEFLSQNEVALKVYLHAVMQGYASQFQSGCSMVKIVAFGEESPQRLICDSHLLITDYSSVAWDFLYLGKPVLFYRFDLRRYLASRDAYLPLDKPLFGEVFFDAREVVAALIRSWKTGFTLTDEYKGYRGSIMPMLDHNNCERIYDLATSLTSQII